MRFTWYSTFDFWPYGNTYSEECKFVALDWYSIKHMFHTHFYPGIYLNKHYSKH